MLFALRSKYLEEFDKCGKSDKVIAFAEDNYDNHILGISRRFVPRTSKYGAGKYGEPIVTRFHRKVRKSFLKLSCTLRERQ